MARVQGKSYMLADKLSKMIPFEVGMTLAKALEQDGRLKEALQIVQRLVELAPRSEHNWRLLMRLHYGRGDLPAAKVVFERLSSMLREEVGTRPSAETLQLLGAVDEASRAGMSRQHVSARATLRPPPMAGRGGAWATMVDSWDSERPFVLVGEAGVGKSRLLADFQQGRAGVVTINAQQGEEHLPYALLRRMLVQIDRMIAPALEPSARSALAQLRAELGVAATATAETRPLLGAMEEMLTGAIAAGLQALMVDDLQYGDRATVEVLRQLTSSKPLSELRVGLAMRPPLMDESAIAEWLYDLRGPVRVDVAALTAADVVELLEGLKLPRLQDDRLTLRLHQNAGGNPLLAIDTLHAGLEVDGARHDPQLALLDSLRHLLDTIFQKLPEGARELLHLAAVAGSSLSTNLAAHILNRPVPELARAWSDLELAGVLRGEAFSHDLMREVALQSVPVGMRKILHGELARLLDAESEADRAKVAWHWEEAHRWNEAARSWDAASEAARRAGRHSEVANHLRRAERCRSLARHDAGTEPIAKIKQTVVRVSTVHADVSTTNLLPAWVQGAVVTAPVRLRIELTIGANLEETAAHLIERSCATIVARSKSAIPAPFAEDELSLIAVFPSGAVRTVGGVHIASGGMFNLMPFSYWDLLDPDDPSDLMAGGSIEQEVDLVVITIAA